MRGTEGKKFNGIDYNVAGTNSVLGQILDKVNHGIPSLVQLGTILKFY